MPTLNSESNESSNSPDSIEYLGPGGYVPWEEYDGVLQMLVAITREAFESEPSPLRGFVMGITTDVLPGAGARRGQ